MSTEDDNKKYYFVQIYDKEISQTFSALSVEKSPVSAWIEGQDKQKAEEYVITDFSPKEMYLSLSPKSKLSLLKTSKNVGRTLYFRLGEDKLLTFTTAVLEKGENRGEYYIHIKNKVFRCQQRVNYRLPSDSYNKIALHLGEDEVMEVIDVSAGGIGIIVPNSEKDRFVEGTEFEDCAVSLNNRKYVITSLEVVSVWKERTPHFQSTGNIEVGMRFKKLSEKVEETLSRDIYSLSREAEIRKTFLKKK